MQFPTCSKFLSASLVLPFVFACGSSTDMKSRLPVNLSLRAVAQTSASQAVSATLQITSIKLLVNQASLGSGDQFGCQDCQGNDGANEVGSVGAVVSVPLDGTAVNLTTEQVQPGTYSRVEVELGGATATPGWASGETVEIQGTNNGTAFTIRVAVNGSFQETLSPPVVVAGPSPSSTPVTITLPVAAWFTSGVIALDPAVPAQLSQIEANIRAAFSGPESGANER